MGGISGQFKIRKHDKAIKSQMKYIVQDRFRYLLDEDSKINVETNRKTNNNMAAL